MYVLLSEMKNYDQMEEGQSLYHSLYTKDGLKSTWKATYTNYLREVAELNNIPAGSFLECWIKDAIDEAMDEDGTGGDLELNERWFKPDEDEDGLMVEDYYLLIAHLLAIRSSTDPPKQLKTIFKYETQLDKHFKKMKSA